MFVTPVAGVLSTVRWVFVTPVAEVLSTVRRVFVKKVSRERFSMALP